MQSSIIDPHNLTRSAACLTNDPVRKKRRSYMIHSLFSTPGVTRSLDRTTLSAAISPRIAALQEKLGMSSVKSSLPATTSRSSPPSRETHAYVVQNAAHQKPTLATLTGLADFKVKLSDHYAKRCKIKAETYAISEQRQLGLSHPNSLTVLRNEEELEARRKDFVKEIEARGERTTKNLTQERTCERTINDPNTTPLIASSIAVNSSQAKSNEDTASLHIHSKDETVMDIRTPEQTCCMVPMKEHMQELMKEFEQSKERHDHLVGAIDRLAGIVDREDTSEPVIPVLGRTVSHTHGEQRRRESRLTNGNRDHLRSMKPCFLDCFRSTKARKEHDRFERTIKEMLSNLNSLAADVRSVVNSAEIEGKGRGVNPEMSTQTLRISRRIQSRAVVGPRPLKYRSLRPQVCFFPDKPYNGAI